MIERVVPLQGKRWRIVRQPARRALALAETTLVRTSVPGGLIFASAGGGRAFLPLPEALFPSEDASPLVYTRWPTMSERSRIQYAAAAAHDTIFVAIGDGVPPWFMPTLGALTLVAIVVQAGIYAKQAGIMRDQSASAQTLERHLPGDSRAFEL